MKRKPLKDLNEDIPRDNVATIDDLQDDEIVKSKKEIDYQIYKKLEYLGIIPSVDRLYNVGSSNYSKHIIQPWSIWLDWNLNAFDADIIKRVLRTKQGESRIQDYKKIIHVCKERIRQLEEYED